MKLFQLSSILLFTSLLASCSTTTNNSETTQNNGSESPNNQTSEVTNLERYKVTKEQWQSIFSFSDVNNYEIKTTSSYFDIFEHEYLHGHIHYRTQKLAGDKALQINESEDIESYSYSELMKVCPSETGFDEEGCQMYINENLATIGSKYDDYRVDGDTHVFSKIGKKETSITQDIDGVTYDLYTKITPALDFTKTIEEGSYSRLYAYDFYYMRRLSEYFDYTIFNEMTKSYIFTEEFFKHFYEESSNDYSRLTFSVTFLDGVITSYKEVRKNPNEGYLEEHTNQVDFINFGTTTIDIPKI